MQRGELAKNSGCNPETIRYYEKIGLIPEPPRTAGGYRDYTREHERRLRFILRARDLGFSLDETRELLRLVDGGFYTCGEVKTITLDHLEDIRGKIADLRRLERTLADVADKCRGGKVPNCPVIDALFHR